MNICSWVFGLSTAWNPERSPERIAEEMFLQSGLNLDKAKSVWGSRKLWSPPAGVCCRCGSRPTPWCFPGVYKDTWPCTVPAGGWWRPRPSYSPPRTSRLLLMLCTHCAHLRRWPFADSSIIWQHDPTSWGSEIHTLISLPEHFFPPSIRQVL